MDDWVFKILSAYGLAGLCIAALSWAVLMQYKSASRINDNRLGERDILIKALENNTQATREASAASVERNRVIEELGKAIEKQASAIELFMVKTELRDESIKERLQDFKLVIDSVAEAIRVNTGMVRVVRDHVAGSHE